MRAFENVNGSHVPKKSVSIKDETVFFPRVIRKALVYIEKNFMNPLSLDEVAKVNAMSRYHFSRIFKLKTGFSFKDYINSKRIQRAKYLIENEDMNVTEAAFAVGYNDLSYFSRVFQKQEGLSPSKYKKSFRPTLRISKKQNTG
jgi:AraC-like DNA-binding protein